MMWTAAAALLGGFAAIVAGCNGYDGVDSRQDATPHDNPPIQSTKVATGGHKPQARVPPETLGYRVCIVSHSMENMASYADITCKNHQRYADLHDYHYQHHIGRISGDQFWDTSYDDTNLIRRQGLYWQSVTAIEQALDRQKPDAKGPSCEQVMWVDADILFTRFDQSLDSNLDFHVTRSSLAQGRHAHQFDVILSRQQWGGHDTVINSGVVIVRNTPGGREFVRAIADAFDAYRHDGCPEQEAMGDYALQRQRQPNRLKQSWADQANTIRDNFFLLPQRAMNSFHSYFDDNSDAPDYQDFAWQQGDYAAHFTGPKDIAEKLETMRRLAADAEASVAAAMEEKGLGPAPDYWQG